MGLRTAGMHASSFAMRRPQQLLAAATLSAAAAATGSLARGSEPKRVCVIGAGAAGLASARRLREAGHSPIVLERGDTVGGLWALGRRPGGVLYDGLVTNLPKEVMAFHDFPFDPALPSYVTAADMATYLERFADAHALRPLVRLGCSVRDVSPEGAARADEGLGVARWRVRYDVHADAPAEPREESFDAVVVANGHYDRSVTPPLPGLAEFEAAGGRVEHARAYDRPEPYAGKSVLVVGARASGTDIAREISAHAARVLVADTACAPRDDAPERFESAFAKAGAVWRVPRLEGLDGARRAARFAGGLEEAGLDVLLFCTGYDYDFPFLKGKSAALLPGTAPPPSAARAAGAADGGAEERGVIGPGADAGAAVAAAPPAPGSLGLAWGSRRVHPLYLQLFAAAAPSLSFIGIPHSVVPFPLFDVQARLVARVLGGEAELPGLPARLSAVDELYASRRRPEDTHHLGSQQWDYCRQLGRAGGFLDAELEAKLRAAEAIYDDASVRRPRYPGADDVYRQNQYELLPSTLAAGATVGGAEPAGGGAATGTCASAPTTTRVGRARVTLGDGSGSHEFEWPLPSAA